MRLFFGLEPLPGEARAIADWRDRSLPVDGRAVPAANFHITLAFLGELDQRRLERLCDAVDSCVDQLNPAGLTLTLDNIGYWSKPRICWLGPSRWPDHLPALAKRLNHIGVSEGGRRERNNYQPHVTLYRSCDTPPSAPAQPPALPMTCDHFSLYESRQGRQGVSYHPLASWALPL
ncbi:2'-5' RNA ligase [Halioglobus japonicus]|uniref:RNA 2',3'-cyclic phosphodiesterase n=1 Tax=Halioglobus japonicus TaxID=930805 RepID=A0AAP8MG59_9GAMM|nr:RNA 2',3'-cyclic phosphodiesterase [Halioglobus japonicus]AQA19857.1 2'-5' RNA ligase [Halioglobus japonicus]PLW87069.1 RNA 2',3'-cyclic phosphodiesterase [Halioglobus japonicus]GHD10375.1 RNA 2',3'-cyclic phosphodiesterase [Halioglobus japonicus]